MNRKMRKTVLLVGACLLGMCSMQAYAGDASSPVPEVQQTKKITGTITEVHRMVLQQISMVTLL